MKFKIGNIKFTKGKTVIIAEAGVNHNGSINIAKRLIDEAKLAGADIIKFQTYKAEELTIKKSPRFWNWEGEKNKSGSQYDSYSILDKFDLKEYKILSEYCKKKNIEFLSTAFDFNSVNILESLNVKGYKIASCDLTNIPLIRYIAKTKKPILLSTGASNIQEIKLAMKNINHFHNNVLIMHCTLCYPTKPEDANLSAILDIQKNFPKNLVGLSDHTLGVDIPVSSVALGVSAIEKHFTVDKRLKKSADHWLSVNPKELKEIVEKTKIINQALGHNYKIKKVLKCELKTRKLARRSVVFSRDLSKNHKIKLDDLAYKRPGTGLPTEKINLILGKKTKKKFLKDHLVSLSDLS